MGEPLHERGSEVRLVSQHPRLADEGECQGNGLRSVGRHAYSLAYFAAAAVRRAFRWICGLDYPGFRTAHGADYTGWPDYLVGTATVPMKEVLQHRADSRTVTLFNKDQLGSGYLELEEWRLASPRILHWPQ